MVKHVARIAERMALLIGAGLVCFGLHQMYPPMALIVAGAMLIAGSLWRRPWLA